MHYYVIMHNTIPGMPGRNNQAFARRTRIPRVIVTVYKLGEVGRNSPYTTNLSIAMFSLPTIPHVYQILFQPSPVCPAVFLYN